MYRRVNLQKILKEGKADKPFSKPQVSFTHLALWKQKLLSKLSLEFSIKFAIEPCPTAMKGFYGLALLDKDVVILFDSEIPNKNWFVSACYHEVGHFLCRRAGRYATFHKTSTSGKRFLRQVLRAERYVDSIGWELVKQRHPEIKYQLSYDLQEDVDLLKNYMRS